MTDTTPHERAIGLLARREYSRAELRERLLRHDHDADEVEATLDCLANDNLQSDARFAEHFVRSRIGRLQGPRKISAELAARGIDRELVREALDESDVDWFELAAQALARRFSTPGADMKARAKRQRFLASRGFDGEQSRHALESLDGEA
ncbi:regulatory protein RecX [Kushneria aurantia]|uniref:Regulatory protein RecX n=1 Tax=Kushneria aurantia TaxID=504092 RepID=A0ABV6G179_9GAMM|nr:regulatory protein RecX [Kushneria aurantia]